MAYLLLVLTPLFWAGNFVLGRAMHTVLPPVTMAGMRWSLALLLILPFVLPRLIQKRQMIRAHWKILVLLGLVGVASFNTLIYIGLTMTTATNATIMQSVIPVVILLITGLLLKEQVSLRQWMGVVLSLAGVLLLITQGELARVLSLSFGRGDIWIMAGVLSWACYSVLLRWKPDGLDGFTMFGVTVVVAVIALIPLAVWELQEATLPQWHWKPALTVVYMALFPSILAYLFWNRGVAELGAAKAGLFIHLMPLYGVLLSALFLGEQIHSYHIIGMMLIFTGIYLAVLAGALKRIKSTSRG